MAATSAPEPAASASEVTDSATRSLDRVIERTLSLAKSWAGLLTAYIGTVTASIIAFQKLPEPFQRWPFGVRIGLLAAPPLCALFFQAIPEIIEQRRKKRLTEISGQVQSGYFQLSPRTDEASFTRADGIHEGILGWMERATSSVLYLTGLSGSGKSSLLAAWVIPKLARKDTLVFSLRGYQDPISVLEQELQRPGAIWQNRTVATDSIKALLERACRHIRPKRLLIILDQFEEFVIFQDPEKRKGFEQLMSDLGNQPIVGLTFLLVFRSDYIGLVEKLALPPLNQSTNWRELPPFTESAAYDFVQGSGLKVSDQLLHGVLREAAEIEQTKGIIRPVTINLCGLVLGRFATGLPRGFRPGGLIRGFLRESVQLRSICDIAPSLLPHLITGYVTKRPRSIAELARETGIDDAVVRGCLRVLGQSDRAIVRPLDLDQQTWEISHDFLVPLLDSIIARWRISFSRRLRPWLPWIAATAMITLAIVTATWRRNPVLDLANQGWIVEKLDKFLYLGFRGTPPKQSVQALERISEPFTVQLMDGDIGTLSGWNPGKNLLRLGINSAQVNDLSPLQSMTNLTTLYLDETRVSDLSPLKSMKNLTTLGLEQTTLRESVTP